MLWLTFVYLILCLILPIKAEFRPQIVKPKQVASLMAFADEKQLLKRENGVWGFGEGASSSTQTAPAIATSNQPSFTASVSIPSPQPTTDISPSSPEPESQSPGSPVGISASEETANLATDTSPPTQTFTDANGSPSESAEYPSGTAPSQASSTVSNLTYSSLEDPTQPTTSETTIAASPDAIATSSSSDGQRLTSGQSHSHGGASIGILIGVLPILTVFIAF